MGNTALEYTESQLVDQQLTHIGTLLIDLKYQKLGLVQTLQKGVLTPAQRAKATELLTTLNNCDIS